MRLIFSQYFKKIVDICLPYTCLCCKTFVEERGLCKQCWSKVSWISEPVCKICGMPLEEEYSPCPSCSGLTNFFDKAVSVFLYDNFSKTMIIRLKDQDDTYLAPTFSAWIYRAIAEFINEVDIIAPVPTSFWKRLWRRYNPPELISEEIHKLADIRHESRLLKKVHETFAQKTLSRSKRAKNLRNSLVVNEKFISEIKGKTILLIDDVMTTGATANECARILKDHQVAKVYVATIARVALSES